MNLIKQIEANLKGINQARFQDLINHLLHVQGYKFIGAPGSVVSKEKTSKGVPDSFFVNGDKYTFVECTTQTKLEGSKTFIEKLLKDIDHCFNEEKSGISKSNIESIILACNEDISANEYKSLKEKVKTYNADTLLEVYNIQNLPMYIYDFPGLAEQYIGVEIIKGEIYNLPDFLVKTTKGLQPSLTNEFVGRKEELEQALEYLQFVDILLLSGAAGVGKSRLAVEILSEVEKNNFIPIVIQSSAVPLWDDFVNLFQNGKDYIILFDDANKSVQNLTYLLDFLQKPKINKLKVVITLRDYVKQEVAKRLNNSIYREILIDVLKDEQIEEIACKILPNLKQYNDIKRRIVELAKGNARVAIMAANSISPNSTINYLDTPVQLYEKYFEKISEEIEAFKKTIMLQALAIVSFFGVLDRKNELLKEILYNQFQIDWDELWSAILELHSHEIVDVYSNEVVKVADQVLATYAFYKCFIDNKTSKLNYANWIICFIENYSKRIVNTLVDVNNTFNYEHIKELVLPHLQIVSATQNDDKFLYSFYSAFWFYKGFDTLLYLKKWVDGLPIEIGKDVYKFEYVHNDHTQAGEYFELLVNFWEYPNAFLIPSLELGIDLLVKQPNRLPKFLKFIDDHFSYKWNDINNGYSRQNILFDVLLKKDLSNEKRKISNGIFLSISKKLLGWHFTQFESSKGMAIKIINFDLYKSPELMKLRERILETAFLLFNENTLQCDSLLNKLCYPRGDIDKQIYVDELPIYNKIIQEKLSVKKYNDCKFVKRIAKFLADTATEYPKEWNNFIESDIIKLSKFLKTEWDDERGKSFEQREAEKLIEFESFVAVKSWEDIEELIFKINDLFQQNESSRWSVSDGATKFVIAIAKSSKQNFVNALHLYFSNKLFEQLLNTNIVYYPLENNLISANELLAIIDTYSFENKPFWTYALLSAVPEQQIDMLLTGRLIELFSHSTNPLPIHRMSVLNKYQSSFEKFVNTINELSESKYNIISYLTEILLSKRNTYRVSLGFQFCQDCSQYFIDNSHLLKQAYIQMKNIDQHFDYDGEELKSVLQIDNYFIVDYIQAKANDTDYVYFRLENLKTDIIWTLNDYENIINQCFAIIIPKHPPYSNLKHPTAVFLTLQNPNEEVNSKRDAFIEKYISINHNSKAEIITIMSNVLHLFKNKFVSYLKQFLLLNNDFEMFRKLWLTASSGMTNSLVAQFQEDIELNIEILSMVKTLPNILSYHKHIDYLEKRSIWLKKDIENQQRRDFEETYD